MMVNELYWLSSVLNDKGISLKEWHREFKPLPAVSKNAPCIRIWLSADGEIRGFEELDAELVRELRKYGNNMRSMPAFNIAPLYRITDKQQIDELQKMKDGKALPDIKEIESWCKRENDNWNKDLVRKVNNCLRSTSQELIDLLDAQNSNETNSFTELLKIANGYPESGEGSFRAALERCVLNNIKRKENIATALTLLIYKGNANVKDPQKDRGSLSVILDLFDWQKYGHTVASGYMTSWINDILIKSQKNARLSQAESGMLDAYGEPYKDISMPMPTVKLKGFDVTLRSMFNGQPCQHRYEKIDDGSFPITEENRSRVKSALEWISADDKKNTTWKKVDKNEIIFACPSMIPQVLPRLVSVFGEDEEGENNFSASFEAVAKKLIDSLNAIPPHEKPESVYVFSIQKLDKARSKVVYSRNYSADKFITSAEQWQKGCLNIPDMRYKQIIPFPLDIAKTINNIWKQNGELANQGKTKVDSFRYYQGVELLLDSLDKNTLQYYLNLLQTNTSALLLYSGNIEHGKSVGIYNKRGGEIKEKEISYIMAVLGLLLYKNGYEKGDYVENTAYLIGQMLKVSDELHAFYCKVKREGDVPPQLAGNSVFVTATETPYRAVAQLATRMNPYIAWAKQFRAIKNEESWRAGWYLSLYEVIMDKLNQVLEETTRFNEFEKAQVFIGYLASLPKKEKIETKSETNIDVINNEKDGYEHGN